MSTDNGLNFQQACDAYFSDEASQLFREAAYAFLLSALINGKLKATGIRTRPTVELKPSPIPEWVFDKPEIDWFKDTIQNAGSKFEQVRIHPQEKRLPSQLGRPSKAATIDRFLSELFDEGTDLTGNQKQICGRVRQKALEDGLSLRGFSEPVIKARLRRLLADPSAKSG